MKKIIIYLLTLVMLVGCVPLLPAEAATTKKINKTYVDILSPNSKYGYVNKKNFDKGQKSVTLKVTGYGKSKVKWSSANKKVATVTSTGTATAKVKSVGKGVTTITATVKGKKYNCKISVIDTDYVRAEATRRLKKLGYHNIPEDYDEDLKLGYVTQEEYDKYYPHGGTSWIEWSCWIGSKRTNEKLVKELVAWVSGRGSQDNAFYLGDLAGRDLSQNYIFKIYHYYEDYEYRKYPPGEY